MFDMIKKALKITGAAKNAGEAQTNSRQVQNDSGFSDYFKLAPSWADDIYTAAVISRNRYKTAFYWIAGVATLLVIALMMLLPLSPSLHF